MVADQQLSLHVYIFIVEVSDNNMYLHHYWEGSKKIANSSIWVLELTTIILFLICFYTNHSSIAFMRFYFIFSINWKMIDEKSVEG